MALPGGPQLHMGDTNFPAAAGKLRLIAKTNKKFYAVDSLGNEFLIEGFAATFVKCKANTAMVAGQLVVLFAALGMADEPDTGYVINHSVRGDETLRVTAKGLTGFTLASSDSSSTSLVDWSTLRTA